ncbi:metallophosphoesterase [[Clostridium] aminophilum]|uniref:metallophosphoesterase n=1 Tax=[Clostridium] aminophilum TaxID=1526 RepID=UPI00332366A7
MKVLIVSDSHRKDGNLLEVIQGTAPFDMMIHLGDGEGSDEMIRGWCEEASPGCEIHMVQGNNDFFSGLPMEEEFMIGPYRTFITHGHRYGVSMGPERLADEAEARGAKIAMFGHTHKPYLGREDGLTVLNPGSISYPRQEGRRPTFAILEIDENGELEIGHYYL